MGQGAKRPPSEQRRVHYSILGVLQKQMMGCEKNLALNPKECIEQGLPTSFAYVFLNTGSEPPSLV